ncbi:hypothetical protein [Candidatus Pelagibacter sp. HIMB1542]|uniref:hypothetical protein n=1 Tax=Candidatus Pelagibacter sp. HIMB1542 TaxID=3413346 RepID=UPI003F82FC29
MNKYNGARSKISKSRKRKFGETKPNFNQMVKDACKRYETSGKKEVGETKPNFDLNYKIKLKKIKKEKVKSDHEKEIDNYIKKRNLERAEELKKIREENNKPKITFIEPIRKDPLRGMRFITNFEPINRGRLGHSKAFLKDVQKPKTYYW